MFDGVPLVCVCEFVCGLSIYVFVCVYVCV